MRFFLALLVTVLAVGCSASSSVTPEAEPSDLRYSISQPVHDTLAVFVREARAFDAGSPIYFVWRVSGAGDRTITLERSPTGCNAVLVAHAGRYVSINGERFALVVGEDVHAVYSEELGLPHPALREGLGLQPGSFVGCWGGGEFPMAVRFSLCRGNEIIQTGRQGVMPKRYINSGYREGMC